MGLHGAKDIELRFTRYVEALVGVIGHADRAGPFRDYCTGLVSISIGELVALKGRFGASIQAIAYRCKDLGIISGPAFSQLFRVFTNRGWRSYPYEEPETIPPEREEPKRFERLCYRALAEKVIGEARAAEFLGISVRQLEARLDQGAT